MHGRQRSVGGICHRPVDGKVAERVGGDGGVEIIRGECRKNVVLHRYRWRMRRQSTDDVVPGRGEATVSRSVHLVVEIAILRSRILEAVVTRVQVGTGWPVRCWPGRRRWGSGGGHARYRDE